MTIQGQSVGESNKVLRVLKGDKLKYTVRIFLPNSSDPAVEFQTNCKLKLSFCDNLRCEMLMQLGTGYEEFPLMEWVKGSILLVEENPKD